MPTQNAMDVHGVLQSGGCHHCLIMCFLALSLPLFCKRASVQDKLLDSHACYFTDYDILC